MAHFPHLAQFPGLPQSRDTDAVHLKIRASETAQELNSLYDKHSSAQTAVCSSAQKRARP